MIHKISKYKRSKIIHEQELPKQDAQPQRLKLNQGILLAGIPLIAYAFLYSYESTYLNYFGVPSQYINFQLPEILSYLTILSILLFLFYSIIDLFYMFSSLLKSNIARYRLMIWVTLSVFAFVNGFISLGLDNYGVAFIYFAGGIIFLLIWITPPLIKYRAKKGSYLERLEQSLLDMSDRTSVQSLADIALKNVGRNLLLLMIFLLFLLYTSGRIGNLVAYIKRDFNVIESISKCAVIYTRTDFIICTTFDDIKKEFSKGYQIFRIDDLKGIKILSENIGPLHPKPTPSPTPVLTNTPTITITPSPSP